MIAFSTVQLSTPTRIHYDILVKDAMFDTTLLIAMFDEIY